MKKLADLFESATGPDYADVPVEGLTTDSRRVLPGWTFVTIPGVAADGARFIPAAIAAGARVIVGEAERPATLAPEIVYLRVGNARRALALAAARFYDNQPETVLAVTGTSGKSSVVDFVRQIETRLGHKAASLGTIGVVTNEGSTYGSLTTPDPVTLHETLANLAGRGITHLAMEASSHGIEQHRLDGVRLKAVGFTNIGRDHLDYHLTIEAYIAAKLRLFEELLPEGGQAIVNADGAFADRFIEAALKRGVPLLTTGAAGHGIRLIEAVADGFAQVLTVEVEGKRITARLPLLGAFQVENALLAAGLVLAAERDRAEEIVAALGDLQGVKGRLERVAELDGALCVVDYAHKPDALAKALEALRPYARRRLVVVFGCGGDRDAGKRPLMGAIAAEKADQVIVTDDNPRSEAPAAIRAAILAAAPGAIEIGDRRAAIGAAVAGLGDGDLLLIAGKGHETGQIVGDSTLPFSDHEAAAAAIEEEA